MSEELELIEGGYQTESAEPTEPTETPYTPQEQVTETAPPQAFTVKYNKEEMNIPYEEAPNYIQKGLNYDKVSNRVNEYETYLNRIAKLTGYESHDEMLQNLEEVERQQEEQRFEELGIDRNQFNSLLEEHPDVQFARQIREEKAQEQRLAMEGQELFAEFPDLKVDQIPAEVWRLREEKGLSLLDSFLRVNYKSLNQQKEQEVIRKLNNNQLTSPGALGREGTEHKTSYSQLSAAEKASLRERVLRGENVQF